MQIVDLRAPFERSLETETGTLDSRIQYFKANILYPHPDLFGQPYFALDDPHIAWYLQHESLARKPMLSFFDSLPITISSSEDAFENAFPRFSPDSVVIYLMPSLEMFDGMTREVEGKQGLLLGIDNLFLERSAAGVIIVHELFHVYHREINPSFFLASSENDLYQYGLYRQVWAEGLASYVSQQLNPGTTERQALGPKLTSLDASQIRRLACLIAANADSTHQQLAMTLFFGNAHPDGLPPRGGYLIGYLIARRLNASMTLEQLAELGGEQLHRLVTGSTRLLCQK